MPFYRFTLDTPLSPKEAIQRVREVTGRPLGVWQGLKWAYLRQESGSPMFRGNTRDDQFHVQRASKNHSSFLPVIDGRVAPSDGGARVRVTMSLHPVISSFCIVWLAMVGSVTWHLFNSPTQDRYSSAFGIVLLMFGLVFPAASFYPEAFKARKLLTGLLGTPQGSGA